MSFQEGYLSELVGRAAVVAGDDPQTSVGKVIDFLVTKPDDTFPRIDGLVLKTKNGERYVPMAEVADVDERGSIVLRSRPATPAIPEDQALYLIRDLFDKQIVDVDGRKVVRINDLEVANTGGSLRVVAADIGVSGLLRRLGAARLLPRLVDRVPRSLIAWDNVAPIADVNPFNIRLSVSENRLSRLHPSELADIISDLSAQDASRVFRSLDDETAADALEHLDHDTQKTIIEDLGTERAADIIEEMDSDDAADLLAELSEERQAELLAEMEPETAGELRDLVKYDEDTAGGLMTTDYVWIYPHRTVAATIDKIREIAPETEFIYYLYVTDERRKLLGVVSLRTLLLALPTGFIHKLMETDIVSTGPDTSAEDVAAMIARYDLLAVPILDEDGKMLGIVTVDDAIDAIMPEKIAKSLPRMVRHPKSRKQSVATG
ncbi:MAG: magnesium transporter MgtE N-terminal domain-containing protein [Vulcanimicrobiaceae bacterium]